MTRTLFLLTLISTACGTRSEVEHTPATTEMPHDDDAMRHDDDAMRHDGPMRHDDDTMPHHGDTMPHGGEMTADQAMYACPAHPEVTAHEPGACSTCWAYMMKREDLDAEDADDLGQ